MSTRCLQVVDRISTGCVQNCCIPVENVSWMLLSEGDEARTSVRARRWRFLALVITDRAEYMGGLLCTSKWSATGRELEDSNVPLASAWWSALLDVSWRSVFCSLLVLLKRPEITESFGGNYCSEFWAAGHCVARDRASAQYPITGCTLPWAQSRLH